MLFWMARHPRRAQRLAQKFSAAAWRPDDGVGHLRGHQFLGARCPQIAAAHCIDEQIAEKPDDTWGPFKLGKREVDCGSDGVLIIACHH